MFKKDELKNFFGRSISDISTGISSEIIFTLDLDHLGVSGEKYLDQSLFSLSKEGLLTLELDADDRPVEYHMKIKSLNDLKYAIKHMDEWEDDWN